MNFVKVKNGSEWFYASSDYYTIDGVRMPVSLSDALDIAKEHNARLPTKEEVDLIWKAADIKLPPIFMTPGPAMSSQRYIEEHNDLIEMQLEGKRGVLIAGHKKDIIQPQRQGRVTIYGWHRTNGTPVQPVSSVHGSSYFDYSHGLRLIRS